MQGHALQTPVYTFYSMVDRRKRLHQDVIAAPGDARCTVLDTTIPYASEVERMGLERRPVTDYAPRSTAARAYRALWDEVRSRVGGLRPRDAFDWPF